MNQDYPSEIPGNPPARYIRLGREQVSMMNPPNDGIIDDGVHAWLIGRHGDGSIRLRHNGVTHPDFIEGKFMVEFCCWINSHLTKEAA
jgi:hypothetical protein